LFESDHSQTAELDPPIERVNRLEEALK
jgi:hypothetical protein